MGMRMDVALILDQQDHSAPYGSWMSGVESRTGLLYFGAMAFNLPSLEWESVARL